MLTIGDSMTFGEGVPAEATFSAVLEKTLGISRSWPKLYPHDINRSHKPFSGDPMFRTVLSAFLLALCTAGVTQATPLDRPFSLSPAAAGRALAGAAAACPTGAICFDAPGVVHIPAPPPGMPVGRVSFPAPTVTAKRFRLSIDVTLADWSPLQPSGKHLIYWFVIQKNIDMPGLLYFLGPDKYEAFARHGMGLKHPQKKKIIDPFRAVVGHTYHVDNDYDMAGGTYTVTVTDTTTGQPEVVLDGRPNVRSYTIKPGLNFLIDMGFFPGHVEGQVPTYGWKYPNVHVAVYQ